MVEQAENILQNIEVQRISNLLSSQGWMVISVDLSGDNMVLRISKRKTGKTDEGR